MKNILVVYFTQTGQARKALDATLSEFNNHANYQIDYLLIKPKNSFPYPWSYTEFFDVFPETVNGVPCELEMDDIDVSKNYDLIFIAYQPWFLSVCVPINSFLMSAQAKHILANKPVITIINCRNMWLGAQEKMKQLLLNVNSNLIGNITYVDKSANLISLVTVLAFVLKGEKGNFLGLFPKYGVTEDNLTQAPLFGKIILENTEQGSFQNIQPLLNKAEAVSIKGNLLLMEGRGRALFPLYANYITKKGGQGSKERQTRVRIFGIVLPLGILILSPIITIISRIAPLIARQKIKKEIEYYSQNSLRKK